MLKQTETAKGHKRRIAKEQKRVAELNALIQKIYEDNVNGKLSDKRFELLAGGYEREQEELEASIARHKAELEDFENDGERADRFVEIVQKHTDFTQLTAPMLREYVEKILVYEADKSSGERIQQVNIYLNFIGQFVAPKSSPLPEEIANEEKEKEKRTRQREAQARYQQRKNENKKKQIA